MHVTRIEIGARPGMRDGRGEAVARSIRDLLGLPVGSVRLRDVYRVDAPLDPGEAERVLRELTDPVLQVGALGRLDQGGFDTAVTVSLKPGVADPVGRSARVAVEDTLGRPLPPSSAVYTSTLYLLGGVDRAGAERVAWELLANPVIHAVRIDTEPEWRGSPPDLSVPRVTGRGAGPVSRIALEGDDRELARVSRERLLVLTVPEMRAIRDHFARRGGAPTDVELECLAQTWSEHCKHKIFRARIRLEEPDRPPQVIDSLFDTYVRGATATIDAAVQEREGGSWLVSVFHDNAGVIAFDERDHLVFKVETHNSPSALDPYGGAITGIVGVNRDPFGTGLGADLLSNVWGYCFASPFHAGPLPRGLLHPRRIREGVHRGVIDGGNQSGIPYARGWELFDERFLGKPLVFCGTIGALPVQVAGRPGHEKAARPGDRIVMAGGRIGADGIHGATFSSAPLDESAPVQAVQIGDPITQKTLFDFLLEARDRGLYTAITDNGAGGLSSSVGEMAQAPGGAWLDLSRAPLKYEGLAPWEVFLSEAQERMTLAVPPERLPELLELARARDVEACDLGAFTDDGVLEVRWGDAVVGRLEMDFLHDGVPRMELVARWTPPAGEEPPSRPRPPLPELLVGMLRRLNLASGESMARHYDHEVKGLTVVKPWVGVQADVPAEATVLLVRHGSTRGYVLSEGVDPFLSDLDTEAMARSVLDLAVRRQLCAGARLDRIAVLDNFCWPDPVESESTPDGAFKLAQLVRACRGLHDAAVAYGTPLISGKDSMKNDSVMGGVKISVPPTLLVSAIGRIDDVREAITLDVKTPGDVVFLLGRTADETGGSEYLRLLGDIDGRTAEQGAPAPYVGSRVPRVDCHATLPLYRAYERAVRAGLVRSAAAPALGGLALALVRSALGGCLGLDVDLAAAPDLADLEPDVALFSQSCGRLLVTTSDEQAAAFAATVPCTRLGRVTRASRLVLRRGSEVLVDLPLEELRGAWKETLGRA